MRSARWLIILSVAIGLALAAFWLLALPAQPARAATFTVNTAADQADGSCADGDCSLRDAIQTAGWGDWIDFDDSLAGQVITLNLGQLTVDKDLTIDASSLSAPIRLSGNNMARVLFIPEEAQVAILSLDIISGTADSSSGGGIYNDGRLTLTGCTLAGNSTDMNGGAIYNSGNLTVNECSFTGNSADYGGAIRNDNLLSVTGSTFTGNFAEWGGAIDNYAGVMTVDSSFYYSNTATYGGGGLTSRATLAISGTTFIGNTSSSGGAVENNDYGVLSVENSSFYSNTSSGVGGGIINLAGSVDVISSTLARNTALGGAGIANYGLLTVTGALFNENSVAEDGGGILNRSTGTARVSASTFFSNTASSDTAGYGGALENYGTLILDSSELISNTARFNGGAIENWGASLEITATSFISNSAISGGALVNNAASLLRMTGSTFQGNSAGEGGALLNDNLSSMTVTDTTFYSNTANNSGGGLYNVSGFITITNSAFSANASAYGGGIRNNAPMTLTLTTFASNTADFGAGVHNVDGGSLAVDRSSFSANSTLYDGAGIYNAATLTVTNSTFDGNSAGAGGGIYNNLTSWVVNSTFYSNTVSGVGGGVINNSGTLTLTNSTLTLNSAGGGGGIGNGNGATLNYRNTIIAGSRSGGDCLSTGTIRASINNLVEDGSCDAAISGDPVLNTLADNGGPTRTSALLPESPAIDTGDSATCTPADQRGQPRNDWICDIGAFELKLADSPVVAKQISGPGVYTFGPTLVKVEVVDPGSLEGLVVTRTTGDHPARTGSDAGNGVGWGEYFTLEPNEGANDTFNANLTLPVQSSPDSSTRVCRYIGEHTWDCQAGSFSTIPMNTITREDVSAFSDWAVGHGVSPTAVRLITLQATSRTGVALLPLLAAALLGSLAAAIWLQRRTKLPK